MSILPKVFFNFLYLSFKNNNEFDLNWVKCYGLRVFLVTVEIDKYIESFCYIFK